MAKAQETTEVPVDDISIKFPYEPYEVQKVYMQKVVECLKEKKFGCLESPTGTGKTLALLCASLAWLQSQRGNKDPVAGAAAAACGNSSGADADIRALLDGGLPSSAVADGGGAWSGAGPPPPKTRIVYASRTHSQLAQVIQEFRNCPYSHVSSVILASRDQLCINEQLAHVADKTQMCRVKIRTRSCQYYNNIERAPGSGGGGGNAIGGTAGAFSSAPFGHAPSAPSSAASSSLGPTRGLPNSSSSSGGNSDLAVGDIESLRRNGEKRKLCPYYVSREMATSADLIFLPYNYLVDPRIRKTLAINLEQCAVIVDEAHNVLKIFEDSSSISFSGKDVAVALSELDYVLKIVEDENLTTNIDSMPHVDLSTVYALKDCLGKLEASLIAFEKSIKISVSTNNASSSEPQGKDFPGDKIVELFGECGVSGQNAAAICKAVNDVIECLSVLSLHGGLPKGKGLTKMSELIELLFMDNHHQVAALNGVTFDVTKHKMKSFYRFHVEKRMDEGKMATNTEYNLWCFHPGFSLSSLIGCKIRTLILTSGTLKPIDSFCSELNQDFPVKLENDHVINPSKQISYQVLTHGPDGTEFLATFANRSNNKYLTALGLAIVQVQKQVPHGLLVFFPSYAWMDTCVRHWQTYDGLWTTMNNIKEVYVEPKDRNALAKVAQEYRNRIKQPNSVGAVFMAVCRGKVSEGIDFADKDARAVVITGIPFPAVKDPKVVLKKKFLDANRGSSSGGAAAIGGAEWYNLEAFRALNQAIGRVIRHKNDFGAVVLLDKRFGQPANAARLPKWLSKMTVENNFRKGMARLAQFFHQNKHNNLTKPKIAITAAAAEPFKPKRNLEASSADSAAAAEAGGENAKRKKIVIKPRGPLTSSSLNATTSGGGSDQSENKTASIQAFVRELKQKLEKARLHELVKEVRAYKEEGCIDNLLALLATFKDQNLIGNDDLTRFQPFVRRPDEAAFAKLFS